jgi:hypothetical protein
MNNTIKRLPNGDFEVIRDNDAPRPKLGFKYYVKEFQCPECSSRLEIRMPDTLWCENDKCDYMALYIVGNGVKRFIKGAIKEIVYTGS